MKFVSRLLSEEINTLTELMKFGPCYRYRQRAHMILLSNKDYMLDEISNIFQIHRNQVSEIIERWESSGLIGLRDLPGKGRQSKINCHAKDKIIAWVEENTPRSIKEVQNYVSAELKLDVCGDTIKHLLKSAGYSWKRLRKAVKHLRSQESFDKAKIEIAALKEQHAAGKIDLQYFDASGFSLVPTVPYAWQKKR